MLQAINCAIPGLEKFLSVSSLQECSDLATASHTFENFVKVKYDFETNYSRHGCARSCSETVHKAEAFYFHRNSWVETSDLLTLPDDGYKLNLAYGSLQLEETVVTLAFDLENFLTSLGGNLDLFLGLSCLSMLLVVADGLARFLG